MGHAVKMSGTEIAAALKAGSREPFRQLLEIFLKAAPTSQEVAEFARRCPDRYAQGVTMLAKLGGYHEKMAVDHSHTHTDMALMQLSDSQLMSRLQDGLKQLGIETDASEAIGLKALPKGGNGANS